jgi:hypothetical protein
LLRYYHLIKGFSGSCKDIARAIAYSQERKLTPIQPRNDDVYLVSFPKSGATWMNFLIANVNIAMSGVDRVVTFYNVHQYVPDIHDSRELGTPLLSFPGFRFIKSHSELNRYYNNLVYIVRNPEDTMISYYNFLRGLGQFNGTLSDLIESERLGIRSWTSHVESWIFHSPASLAFMMVRYEDLKRDPAVELERIYYQLGFSLQKTVLDKAVELSSFSNMKKLEEDLNYGGRPIMENFQFMRSGQSGEGKAELSKSDIVKIGNCAGHLMERLGYL